MTLALSRTISIGSGVSGTFDTQGYTMTVAVPISGAGGNLVKIGTGALVSDRQQRLHGHDHDLRGYAAIGQRWQYWGPALERAVTDNGMLAFSRSDSGMSFSQHHYRQWLGSPDRHGNRGLDRQQQLQRWHEYHGGNLQLGNSAALGSRRAA